MNRRNFFKGLAAVAAAPLALLSQDGETVVRAGAPYNTEIVDPKGTLFGLRAGKAAIMWETVRQFAMRYPEKKAGIYTPDGMFTVQFKPNK